jgi:hypothetical protein
MGASGADAATAAVTPHEEAAPEAVGEAFVTETMADLYLQQGHLESALDIYRKLVEQRPGDAQLRERLGVIERRVLGTSGLTPATAASVPEETSSTASSAQRAAPAVPAAGPTIREFLGFLTGRALTTSASQPPEASPSIPAPAAGSVAAAAGHDAESRAETVGIVATAVATSAGVIAVVETTSEVAPTGATRELPGDSTPSDVVDSPMQADAEIGTGEPDGETPPFGEQPEPAAANEPGDEPADVLDAHQNSEDAISDAEMAVFAEAAETYPEIAPDAFAHAANDVYLEEQTEAYAESAPQTYDDVYDHAAHLEVEPDGVDFGDVASSNVDAIAAADALQSSATEADVDGDGDDELGVDQDAANEDEPRDLVSEFAAAETAPLPDVESEEPTEEDFAAAGFIEDSYNAADHDAPAEVAPDAIADEAHALAGHDALDVGTNDLTAGVYASEAASESNAENSDAADAYMGEAEGATLNRDDGVEPVEESHFAGAFGALGAFDSARPSVSLSPGDGSIESLFAARGEPAEAEEAAALSLAAAFANEATGEPALPFFASAETPAGENFTSAAPADIEDERPSALAEPAVAAADDAADAEADDGFSFDQFFADDVQDSTPSAPRDAEVTPGDPADVAQFNQWLNRLKKT